VQISRRLNARKDNGFGIGHGDTSLTVGQCSANVVAQGH
jgi:hypothetical protein